MATILADNAFGTLASGLTAGDTTLNFTSGHGARFPTVTAPDVLYCCILNTANVLEEIRITAHTSGSDSCTIERAQGSTTAKAWSVGDRIEARLSNTSLLSLNVASATTATSAGVSTNISGGAAGQIAYQIGTGSTGFVSGTASDVFISGGTGAPYFLNRGDLNVGRASTAITALAASTATWADAAGTSTNLVGKDVGSIGIGCFGFFNAISLPCAPNQTETGTNLRMYPGTSANGAVGVWRNVGIDTAAVTVASMFQRIS